LSQWHPASGGDALAAIAVAITQPRKSRTTTAASLGGQSVPASPWQQLGGWRISRE
jgi:hypothetical protein